MTDPPFDLRREPVVLAAGAVHVPDWLDRDRQEFLLRACAGWVRRIGAHPVTLPGGGRMTVRTAWLGRRWEPYRYVDSEDVEPIPDWLLRAGSRAVAAAAAVDDRVLRVDAGTTGLGASRGTGSPDPDPDAGAGAGGAGRLDPWRYRPDAALINIYGPGSSMGLHRDRDERRGDPVVSLSLGDAAVFRFGTPGHRGPPYTDVRLESGDLVVFGGPSRTAFHGVPRVYDGTAPSWCAEVLGGRPGRVNITLRRTR